MIRLKMENFNMILTEKEHNHLKKLVNINILHVKKYYFLIKEE